MRVLAVLAAVAAGCDAGAAELSVVRTGDRLELRAAELALTATIDPGGGRVRGRVGGVAFVLAPGPQGWALPAGELTAGGASIVLATELDGAPAWIAHTGGAAYRLWREDDRAALAAALPATPFGDELARAAPYHAHARAWMPELRGLFAVAAVMHPATTLDPATWPASFTPLDLEPPGLRDGDRPGLGMTCSTAIRCPGDAPICVTETHDDAFGFCTRACLAGDECEAETAGACGLAIDDVPGVPAGLRGCYLPCPGGACPALLACQPAYGGVASPTCAP